MGLSQHEPITLGLPAPSFQGSLGEETRRVDVTTLPALSGAECFRATRARAASSRRPIGYPKQDLVREWARLIGTLFERKRSTPGATSPRRSDGKHCSRGNGTATRLGAACSSSGHFLGAPPRADARQAREPAGNANAGPSRPAFAVPETRTWRATGPSPVEALRATGGSSLAADPEARRGRRARHRP